MRHHVLSMSALLWLACSAAAQRTIIVDSVDPSTADFADLQPAIDAARPGDTVLVRDTWTLFGPISVDKGITLIGEPTIGVPLRGSLTIRGVPDGQKFVTRLCNVNYPLKTNFIDIKDCRGEVVLSDTTTANMSITRCRSVFLNWAGGGDGLRVIDSQVTLTSSKHWAATRSGTIPLRTWGSRIVLANSDLIGDRGHYDVLLCQSYTPPLHAVEATDSEIVMAGSNSLIAGGYQDGGMWCSLRKQAPAILATGNVRIYKDPDAYFLGPVVGPHTLILRSQPALMGRGAAYGDPMDIELHSHPYAPFAVLIGVPRQVQPTPLGDLYLDLPSSVPLVFGMTNVNGWFAQGVPAIWPGIPRGFVLCAQAGVLWPTGVELSTPTMLVMTKF